jgi:hypothetical protein
MERIIREAGFGWGSYVTYEDLYKHRYGYHHHHHHHYHHHHHHHHHHYVCHHPDVIRCLAAMLTYPGLPGEAAKVHSVRPYKKRPWFFYCSSDLCLLQCRRPFTI